MEPEKKKQRASTRHPTQKLSHSSSRLVQIHTSYQPKPETSTDTPSKLNKGYNLILSKNRTKNNYRPNMRIQILSESYYEVIYGVAPECVAGFN